MKKRMERVCDIVQYETNSRTGESLNFGEENIKVALKHKSIKRYAYIRHDKDVYTKDDVKKHLKVLKEQYHAVYTEECRKQGFPTSGETGAGQTKDEKKKQDDAVMKVIGNWDDFCKKNQYVFEGKLKPPHWHLIIEAPNKVDVASLANWLGVPQNCIEIPNGRGAFLDNVGYLSHSDDGSILKGKHLYDDAEVIANFDWRQEIEARSVRIAKLGRDFNDDVEQMLYEVLYNGMTLRQCEQADPLIYMNNLDKLTKLRLNYIQRQNPPSNRINYYIYGKGGVGKDLMSRALARALFPQYENDDDIYFVVGAGNVTFDGYDGQPVLIWSDRRAGGLIKTLGGRENFFNIFETHPTKQRQNIKYGSVNLTNCVNIINGQEDYVTFLDGIAGEYKDRDGELHLAEDKGQSYRRFPFIIPLHDADFDLLVNKGYYLNDRRLFQEYYEYNGIRGNMQKIVLACGGEQESRPIASKVIKKVTEKHWEALDRQAKNKLSEDEVFALMEKEGWGTQADADGELIENPKVEQKIEFGSSEKLPFE